MANGRRTLLIKRVRREVLVAMKTVYPAALQADQIMRSLLPLFPALEFDQLKRDLHYLWDKAYIYRVVSDRESDPKLTPWRRRWFRLAATGVEIADRCVTDPALSES